MSDSVWISAALADGQLADLARRIDAQLTAAPGAAPAPQGETKTFADGSRGVTFRYPADWSVHEATPYLVMVSPADSLAAPMVALEVRPDMVIGPFEKAVDEYLKDMRTRVSGFTLQSRKPVQRTGFTHGVELAWSDTSDRGQESVTELQLMVSQSRMVFVRASASPQAWVQHGSALRAILASVARYP
jgi:hypothetical protein